jgi:hypothetical protein
MTQTLTLTTATIVSARVALLSDANKHASAALEYVENGWNDCAAFAAQLSFRYSRAYYELALSAE